MRTDLTRSANRIAHLAHVGLALPLHRVSRTLQAERPPTSDEIRSIRARRLALADTDLTNARDGHYPLHLVFDRPALRDPTAWPLALRDYLSLASRRAANAWQVDPDVGRRFPPYYRRRFHWQKDGYLSRRSARRYDLGVELLFLGAADTMRRQALPPITTTLPTHGTVLDVACGTGRTLAMLAAARPDARLTGLDLSPWYITEARRKLDHPDTSLLVGNAESIPFPDDHFDVVTSTFLFHELPRPVRRRVAREMARVCKSGGRIVIADAAQLSDAAELGPLLHAFHQSLHEPFFADHLEDPIEDWLEEVGLAAPTVLPAFVAKVVHAEVS